MNIHQETKGREKASAANAGCWRCLWWFDQGHAMTAILCAPDVFQPFGDELWLMKGMFKTEADADQQGHKFEALARQIGLKNSIIYVRAHFFPEQSS